MFSFIKKLDSGARRLLYTCFFAFFCNGALALTMGSVMPDLKAAYRLTDTMGGLMLSAHSAGNLIAGFLSGLVPLYLGEKRAVMLLHALAFLGLLMTLLFGSPLWLILAFTFTGIGRGSISNFDNRMVNRLSGGSPAASNLLHSTFAVGAISAPMIFLALRTWISWRAGVGFVIFCGIVSLFNFSRATIPDDGPRRSDKSSRSMAFMKNPSFLILAMMMFCYLCSEYAINGWLVSYIQNKEALLASFGAEGERLTEAVRAYSQTMATLLWCVMLVGRVFCAVISARVHQKKLMMLASFGAAAFFFLMLSSASIPMVSLSVAGLGFCMAGICPMIYADAAKFTNAYPMATGALLAVGSAGAVLMPTVVGAVAQRTGFSGGMKMILFTVLALTVFSTLNALIKPRGPEPDKA